MSAPAGEVIPFRLKPGREVLDPLNRVVTITRVLEEGPAGLVEVRLAGPYGAHIRYPASCLRPVE